MTPAINAAQKSGIDFKTHEYEHDPDADSYGLEAVQKLGQDPLRVFKTLVVEAADGTLAVGVVPVAQQLNLKSIAKAIGAKKAAMAAPAKVERVTGYVLGGCSPLGQKRALPTVIDASARQFDTIHVSAGRRGLEIELGPDDLAKLTRGKFAEIAR